MRKSMMRCKRVLAFVLVFLFVVQLVPIKTAMAAEVEGDWKYDYYGGGVKIILYQGNASNVVIPSQIAGKNVVALGTKCFNYKDVVAVTIPNTVTTLEDEVFLWCRNLRSLYIPASVTTIGKGITYGCTALEQIVVDPGNQVYDSRRDCNAIIHSDFWDVIAGCKNTVIPTELDGKIAYGAFGGMTSMTSITLPSTLYALDHFAFCECSSLKEIVIPSTVGYVGNYVFDQCDALSKVVNNSGKTIALPTGGALWTVNGVEVTSVGGRQTAVRLVGEQSVKKDGIVEKGSLKVYVKNGVEQFTYTGLAYDSELGWWYVENGYVNTNYNGLIERDGVWHCVRAGQVIDNYTGLWSDPTVGWWYVNNGVIDFSYNGFVENENGWWCVAGGRVAFEYTGLWYGDNVGWWYVNNGAINFAYNGLIEYNGSWWCVAGGRVAFEYTGLWSDPVVGWWYVENGMIIFAHSGFVPNELGWWYVDAGRVAFEKNGICYDATVGMWYVTGGMIDFNYNGTASYNGTSYKIVNGFATN